jgi:hypothetical protein
LKLPLRRLLTEKSHAGLPRLTSITRVELNTIGHFIGKGCPSG